ncbi:hypothetical protein SAMN05216223_104125 [Actinacidiphila yanglinensis]|uniref:GST N-terminal domain-containing protein n=1 Tax=Actinacidiphila yanglinensis TaxID=310779 RepID=A0A1H5YS28_9ACTN|nr:hypothetical protein [Actinacidiphila yanglinensis]SEG26999.1 hypothetical protein SAMN05216223_104125 [Actinacidiphila yanglinensis]
MYPSKIVTAAVLAAATAATLATAGTATAAAARTGNQPVEVVRPGQVVDTGHGVDLQLNRTDRCLGTPVAWSCKSVVDGNQPPGTVSVQTQGDATGTVYSPLYIGSGKAARMTVTEDGVTYDVQVVTLPGSPGYATGWAWGAPQSDLNDIPQVTVFDRSGAVLAQS